MQVVTRNSATDYHEVVVDWTPLPSGQDGDSEILGYQVQYKLQSSSTWRDIVLPESDFLLTQARVVDNIVKGELYDF